MSVFYTFDRVGDLKSGVWLSPNNICINEEPFSGFLTNSYPSGISRHGQNYIENPRCCFNIREGALELYFEEVRKACYPDKPSRFESMFCCESIDDALRMAKGFGAPNASIYEVEVKSNYHRGNMALLDNSFSILATSYHANAYWRGDELNIGKTTFWEIVAQLPVQIGKKVR